MKAISIFLLHFFIPFLLFSQPNSSIDDLLKSKIITNTATAFFIKNTEFKKYFLKQYCRLTKSYKRHNYLSRKKNSGYRIKDTVLANKQIMKLNRYTKKAFPILMKTRLNWEFVKHLQKKDLGVAGLYLTNKKDSAFYFYITGQFYKDSINEILARKLGYVKSDNKGSELVDWGKMNNLRFSKWTLETITPGTNSIDLTIPDIGSAFIPFFEKAVIFDANEFFYIIELLLPLIKMEDEKMVQQIIIKYMDNYTLSEQKWLKVQISESISREENKNKPKIETL